MSCTTFSLRKSSDQATVANTNTLITWDVATMDTDSGFSNANDTWTVPTGKGGKYFLSLNVGFSYGTRFILYIYVNGANTYELDTNSPNNYTGINLNCIATLNASDVVKTHYYSVTSTGNIRYQNSTNNFVTRFEGFKLIGA